MDGRGTAPPFIQATFFRLGFVLHRLGVSGLWLRFLSRFHAVGGGSSPGIDAKKSLLLLKLFAFYWRCVSDKGML